MSRAVVPLMKAEQSGRSSTSRRCSASCRCGSRVHTWLRRLGVVNLTRSMALELAPHGILVNGIAPGSTATDGWKRWIGDAKSEELDLHARLMSHIPLARPATPEEIANGAALSGGAGEFVHHRTHPPRRRRMDCRLRAGLLAMKQTAARWHPGGELPNRMPLPDGLSAERMIGLYRTMVMLRKFELAAQIACRKERPRGSCISTSARRRRPPVFARTCARPIGSTSTHRGHGHALAKGMDPRVLMAELYGKHDGCCGGRGGTMHLYDAGIGLFGTNGLVGGGIPSAVGAGISAKYRGTDGVAVSFFGDGATNHAAFHEAINFASVRRAPVVLVCENNLYATATALVLGNPQSGHRVPRRGIRHSRNCRRWQ